MTRSSVDDADDRSVASGDGRTASSGDGRTVPSGDDRIGATTGDTTAGTTDDSTVATTATAADSTVATTATAADSTAATTATADDSTAATTDGPRRAATDGGRTGRGRPAVTRRRPGPVVAELRRRNPILFGVAALHVALFVAFLAGIALDPRTVGSDPAWLKPAKFAGSIALVTATLGWLGAHLPVDDRTLRRVSIGVGAALVLEIALIAGQAARGVGSHFNESTLLDLVVYRVMGATIVGATLLVAWLLVCARRGEFAVAPAFERGILLGLALFVLGAFEGGAMIALHDHAVGSGPSIPVVGWVLGGDFRVAHFLGLHALQVLPLAGYLAAVAGRRGAFERPARLVTVVGGIYGAALVATFAHALAPLAAP